MNPPNYNRNIINFRDCISCLDCSNKSVLNGIMRCKKYYTKTGLPKKVHDDGHCDSWEKKQ